MELMPGGDLLKFLREAKREHVRTELRSLNDEGRELEMEYGSQTVEDFLFNFLNRDQKSLEDKEEDSLWKKVDFK